MHTLTHTHHLYWGHCRVFTNKPFAVFPLVNRTEDIWVCSCFHSVSVLLNKVPCVMLTLTLSCLDMVRLSTCFHKEFACMLSTDPSTKAAQPFFIYPREIPPEDTSPLLSFLPLLRDDHAAPVFTSNIRPGDDRPPWQREWNLRRGWT